MDRIELYSSKKKSLILLIGSLTFIVLGFWLLLEAENLTSMRAEVQFLFEELELLQFFFADLVFL